MKKDRAYNFWTLRFFDKALEEAYREDDFFKSLKKFRSTCLETAFLYAIFGILDGVILPDQKEICWIIRFCFVCPLLIGSYFFSFSKQYRKFKVANTLLVGSFISVGIIAMISIAPSPGDYLYYAGLLLCSMFFYGRIPDHIISNCLSWGTFGLYLIAAVLFTDTPTKVLFSNTFIYFFFNIAGMFVCYSLELSRRLDYLQRLTIERQAGQLERALREKEQERQRAEELSLQDPLTGLANRRHFFYVADKAYERKLRYRHSLSIMLLDIDHFKGVNDTFGHGVGDQVLQKVAVIIAGSIRKSDLACRYGGEEFAVLLPDTDVHTARQLGHRLLRSIEQTTITLESGQVFISASMGIAGLTERESAPPSVLLERADQVLYQAKNAGRNQLRLWERLPDEADPFRAQGPVDVVGTPGR
ncbi:MAG: GGDEF domain-containing protein [Pedobacter sp.]